MHTPNGLLIIFAGFNTLPFYGFIKVIQPMFVKLLIVELLQPQIYKCLKEYIINIMLIADRLFPCCENDDKNDCFYRIHNNLHVTVVISRERENK